MTVHFYEASQRHFQDAVELEGSSRHQNADHLYALASECALKAILVGLGVIRNPENVQRPFKEHIDVLWGEYHAVLSGRTGSKYVISSGVNPFDDWKVRDRYEADWETTAVPLSAAIRRKITRKDVMSILENARNDGVIS